MISEQMTRAGWREMSSDEVRRAWEAKGGRWQSLILDAQGNECVGIMIIGRVYNYIEPLAYRPVHPSTWDYAPEGWGVAATAGYLMQSDIGGDDMLFWRTDSRGYTFDIDDAEVFTEERARQQVSMRPDVDVAWPLEHIRAKAKRHTSIEDVDHSLAIRGPSGRKS